MSLDWAKLPVRENTSHKSIIMRMVERCQEHYNNVFILMDKNFPGDHPKMQEAIGLKSECFVSVITPRKFKRMENCLLENGGNTENCMDILKDMQSSYFRFFEDVLKNVQKSITPNDMNALERCSTHQAAFQHAEMVHGNGSPEFIDTQERLLECTAKHLEKRNIWEEYQSCKISRGREECQPQWQALQKVGNSMGNRYLKSIGWTDQEIDLMDERERKMWLIETGKILQASPL